MSEQPPLPELPVVQPSEIIDGGRPPLSGPRMVDAISALRVGWKKGVITPEMIEEIRTAFGHILEGEGAMTDEQIIKFFTKPPDPDFSIEEYI